jgi:hypothetical protein
VKVRILSAATHDLIDGYHFYRSPAWTRKRVG